MRSSQIFSVCGLPDVRVKRIGTGDQGQGEGLGARGQGLEKENSSSSLTPSPSLPSPASWPRRLRSLDDGDEPPCRQRCSRLVPRHRL
jgi:hypothetical protein